MKIQLNIIYYYKNKLLRLIEHIPLRRQILQKICYILVNILEGGFYVRAVLEKSRRTVD
jgi:hypothetical protein